MTNLVFVFKLCKGSEFIFNSYENSINKDVLYIWINVYKIKVYEYSFSLTVAVKKIYFKNKMNMKIVDIPPIINQYNIMISW